MSAASPCVFVAIVAAGKYGGYPPRLFFYGVDPSEERTINSAPSSRDQLGATGEPCRVRLQGETPEYHPSAMLQRVFRRRTGATVSPTAGVTFFVARTNRQEFVPYKPSLPPKHVITSLGGSSLSVPLQKSRLPLHL